MRGMFCFSSAKYAKCFVFHPKNARNILYFIYIMREIYRFVSTKCAKYYFAFTKYAKCFVLLDYDCKIPTLFLLSLLISDICSIKMD